MGQIIRCPLVGTPCTRSITIQEKTFFLAEAEEPEYDRKHRSRAIGEAIVDGYKIRSALEEKNINAFTCKICEMIQTCAYGMADISQNNANVFMELGMMLALGKPTVILAKKGQEQRLKLPSDVSAIEVILFDEYLDIVDQLREVVKKLPPTVPISSPLEDIDKLNPHIAEELRKIGDGIVKQFEHSIREAKLDTVSPKDEKREISPDLSDKLRSLEEKLEDLTGLGFVTDEKTAFMRGNYFYGQKKFEKALANYNWSLGLAPDDPTTLTNRGLTYDELERYDEALADFNRSLEITPDDPNTLYNLACLFSLWGKTDDALAYLKKAIDKDAKYREMAKTDKDFDNIKDPPRFKEIISE